jgi:2-oxoglutarate ferredoxin oxidoreductase subunit delta
MPRRIRRKRLVIRREWCKGCNICVEFCPEGILSLDEEEKVVISDESLCTECRLCELRCPDFAMELKDLPPTPPPEGGQP